MHPAPTTTASPWAIPVAEVATVLGLHGDVGAGLSSAEVEERRRRHGKNELPHPPVPGVLRIAARQFKSPLILVLVVAAVVSAALGEVTDAFFIAIVLIGNAVIGTIQERGAEKSAEALRAMLVDQARVLRDGVVVVVPGVELVPGDVVRLEPGDKVPADLRLLEAMNLSIDESMLTGESVAVDKRSDATVARDAGLGDRPTMAFAGTLVSRGHARGVVVATAGATALGGIAGLVLGRAASPPPLLVRMEAFTRRIAVVVLGASVLLGVIEFARGAAIQDVFLMAVALAVSAIPEGLPIALTVALSLGARRMAARGVIARRLVSVEALGSTTFIASDKTGTLTKNEMTVDRVVFIDGDPVRVDDVAAAATPQRDTRWQRLALATALDNDATLTVSDTAVTGHGDAVDVALLRLAQRFGVVRDDALLATHPRRAALPFEAERQFAAAVHDVDGRPVAFVKGAPERVVAMCTRGAAGTADVELDAAAALQRATALAASGARVLAVAAGPIDGAFVDGAPADGVLPAATLQGLTLLGFVGMKDPLRPEAQAAVAACRRAGIEVAMVTGDHPVTALAIARELGIAPDEGAVADLVVTGPEVRAAMATGTDALDALVRGRLVFARIEPEQKLGIVESLKRAGHFVAVTGDGANDAPALRAAHIGVAMGARGTDVARETAGLIVTDDNFASIVAGVEEGRGAYDNVRKVIFLAISTGAAEILIFMLAVLFGTPLPLLPIQLLWLNLVTNGIQDVGLAFEPRERDVLKDPPRRPDEAIFDRVMITRVLVSATLMSVVAFAWFKILLDSGVEVAMARNQVLLLMVLFENIHAGNCRSETMSLFVHNPLRNKVLFIGTAVAQVLHLIAMHVPGLSSMLGISPVSVRDWFVCAGLALSLLVASELEKLWRRLRPVR